MKREEKTMMEKTPESLQEDEEIELQVTVVSEINEQAITRVGLELLTIKRFMKKPFRDVSRSLQGIKLKQSQTS